MHTRMFKCRLMPRYAKISLDLGGVRREKTALTDTFGNALISKKRESAIREAVNWVMSSDGRLLGSPKI